MTIKARNRMWAVGAVVAAIAIAVSLLPMIASSGGGDAEAPKRDVRLVIRDMAYYLDGKGEANPTLHFRRGERIRLVVVSEDAGMEHDFVVPTWKVATKAIEGRGEDAITIRVPKTPGTDIYFCSPHAGKMRGTVVVE